MTVFLSCREGILVKILRRTSDGRSYGNWPVMRKAMFQMSFLMGNPQVKVYTVAKFTFMSERRMRDLNRKGGGDLMVGWLLIKDWL